MFKRRLGGVDLAMPQNHFGKAGVQWHRLNARPLSAQLFHGLRGGGLNVRRGLGKQLALQPGNSWRERPHGFNVQ
jgi:hypothetical protein